MDESQVGQILAREVSEPVRQGIVNALDQAYAVRRSYHDPSIGDDGQYFGMGIYKSGKHFLTEFVEEDARREGVTVFQPGQMFALKAGPILLAPYRIPDRGFGGSDRAFPYNDSGAGKLAELNYQRRVQRHMFADHSVFPWDVGPRIGIVIAHSGDPHVGLTSVSFREPVDENGGRICEWGYSEMLWPDAEDGTAGGGQVFPPEEPITPPSVDLKADISANKSQEDDADGGAERPSASSDES